MVGGNRNGDGEAEKGKGVVNDQIGDSDDIPVNDTLGLDSTIVVEVEVIGREGKCIADLIVLDFVAVLVSVEVALVTADLVVEVWCGSSLLCSEDEGLLSALSSPL